MASVNKVIWLAIGFLDPEVKSFQNGGKVLEHLHFPI